MGRLTGSCAWENSTLELSLMRRMRTNSETERREDIQCSALFFALVPLHCFCFASCSVRLITMQFAVQCNFGAVQVWCSVLKSNEKKARQCITPSPPCNSVQRCCSALGTGGRGNPFFHQNLKAVGAGAVLVHCSRSSQVIGGCNWWRDYSCTIIHQLQPTHCTICRTRDMRNFGGKSALRARMTLM